FWPSSTISPDSSTRTAPNGMLPRLTARRATLNAIRRYRSSRLSTSRRAYLGCATPSSHEEKPCQSFAVGFLTCLSRCQLVSGAAVIPGLHNSHRHPGLRRGTAQSKSLWGWLKAYVDPAHRALTPEIAEAASMLCYTVGLRAGTTSVMDMWRFMEGSARAAEAIGLRATLVPYVADVEGFDYFETLESNRRLLESHRASADGRIRAWVGLEHLFYCTPEAFRAAAALAEEFDTGIHTHSS